MTKETRNALRNTVSQCRRLLEEALSKELQGRYGIHASGKIEPESSMKHLSPEDLAYRKDLIDHYEHICASGAKPKDGLAQLVREIAFTHLNRLCAYKMMEAREVYVGGQKFREAVSRGVNSNGVKFYLAEHPEDERLFNTGRQDLAYRHFLDWLGGLLSEEIGVLFSPNDPANRLYPPQRVLDDVLTLINDAELVDIWSQDETIGWVYQYFTPKELRDQAREESQAPRNSYELAFRNQFFTPRYVVEFLTDNTLGRIWYEMRKGDTRLKDQCRYLVRRPDEVFLEHVESDAQIAAQQWLQGLTEVEPEITALAHTVNGYIRAGKVGEQSNAWVEARLAKLVTQELASELKTQELLDLLFLFVRKDRFCEGTLESLKTEIDNILAVLRNRIAATKNEEASQDELLKLPIFVPTRPKKDPRELKTLDPACGSGHFLLYCFELLLTIYEEAWSDPELGPGLQRDFASLDELRRAAPTLILAKNLHGIDIDLRCTQIAALALWLRCQRSYQDMGFGKDRPKIMRSNIACAEPMPGDQAMLKEFVARLEPKLLGQLVDVVFEKMKIAGDAGSLLQIEEEIRGAIVAAKKQWISETERATDRKGRPFLFSRGEMDRLTNRTAPPQLFDLSEITDDQFFAEAESQIAKALLAYAEQARNGLKLQHRLFADDALRGFGFVDCCRLRFDAVLMNPPFGELPTGVLHYLKQMYPNSGTNLAGLFLVRACRWLVQGGLFGFIGPRATLFLRSTEGARTFALLKDGSLRYAADLGLRVMDGAWIEACALVSQRAEVDSPSVFIRLLDVAEKQSALAETLDFLSQGTPTPRTYIVNRHTFLNYPNNAISYALPPSYLALFRSGQTFEETYGTIRQGLATADDFRYLRLLPELSDSLINGCYLPFAKGGEYSPFFGTPELLVYWVNDGICYWTDKSAKTGLPRSNIWMLKDTATEYFRREGLTYTQRTNSAFAPRILPRGCVFATKGESIFCRSSEDLLLVLGVMQSKPFQVLVEAFVSAADSVQSEGQARSYLSGTIKRLPLPYIPAEDSRHSLIVQSTRDIVNVWRKRASTDPISQLFVAPWTCTKSPRDMSLRELTYAEERARLHDDIRVLERSWTIEKESRELFQLTEGDIAFIHETLGHHVEEYPEGAPSAAIVALYARTDDQLLAWLKEQGITGRQFVNQSYHSSRKTEILSHLAKIKGSCVAKSLLCGSVREEYRLVSFVADVLDWLFGCCVGHWKVDVATHDGQWPSFGDPFEALPASPPGRLSPSHGGSPGQSRQRRSFQGDPDGIFVDDSEHPDDIVRLLGDAIEVVWGKQAETIETEACEILGVANLREYIRKGGKAGLWEGHIARFSKSRRKCPIYWLLQSSKRNYGIWLYYHRLDKDIFFKALINYVEPKIRLEDSRLTALRSQKAAVAESGKAARTLDRDIEKQEDLLSELRDFEDKLRRVANLRLEPDLNDGVVLNIAPLHELVPWKVAKDYWEELLEGKYEWSSIGKQLHQKGLVK